MAMAAIEAPAATIDNISRHDRRFTCIVIRHIYGGPGHAIGISTPASCPADTSLVLELFTHPAGVGRVDDAVQGHRAVPQAWRGRPRGAAGDVT
jgi:hypothetical protein